MADFTVRVELHGAEWDEYEILHAEMEAQGFSRRIRGESGDVFELPPAEYSFSGAMTRQNVIDRAIRAADLTACSYGILVTQSAGRAWYNLDLAE